MKAWLIPALAALGLADSAYLAGLHWLGTVPPCGGYEGCAAVNSSAYAEVFGVPVAAFGTAMYALALGLSLWRVGGGDRALRDGTPLLYSLVLGGSVFMAYLTAVELFVLHDYCYWCLGLAAITLLLLVLVVREALALNRREAPMLRRIK